MLYNSEQYLPKQTAQTQIRLLLKKQSDQGLPCLLFAQTVCSYKRKYVHEVLVNCLVSLIDRDFGYYFVILLPLLNLSFVDGHISVSSVCQRSGKLFMIIIYYVKCSEISNNAFQMSIYSVNIFFNIRLYPRAFFLSFAGPWTSRIHIRSLCQAHINRTTRTGELNTTKVVYFCPLFLESVFVVCSMF